MALGRQARATRAVQTFEVEEAIVERIDEVRGRRPRLSAADAAVFEHDDGLPNLGKQIGCREAGDARADDADVA